MEFHHIPSTPPLQAAADLLRGGLEEVDRGDDEVRGHEQAPVKPGGVAVDEDGRGHHDRQQEHERLEGLEVQVHGLVHDPTGMHHGALQPKRASYPSENRCKCMQIYLQYICRFMFPLLDLQTGSALKMHII